MTTESMRPYPAYKDSGIEWIGEIPEGWEIKKLKWLADIKLSNIDKKSKEDESTVKLCNYVDVYYNDNITPNIKFMVATASKNQINALSLEKGDVLITKDSESPDDIAVPAFVPESLSGIVCGYHLARIRPNENAYGNYLFRSFISNGIRDQFEMNANGITRFGIGKYTIDNSLFFVPPLTEQQSIATFLDNQTAKIDTLIENKQKQIELLKEERTAIINQAVTKGLNPDVPMRDSGIEWLGEIPEHWEIKPLKYVVLINQNALPENTNENYEIQYIDIGNVGYGILRNPPEKMNFGKAPSRARRIVKSGDTIISTVRTYLKAITYIDFEDENIIASTGFAVISTTNQIDEKYLYFVASSQKFIDTISSLSVGVSYPAISSSQISLIPIWFPHSINEQQKIVQLIETNISNTDRIISQIQQQITLLKEYRTALISEAVTGKIDVRHEKGKELI